MSFQKERRIDRSRQRRKRKNLITVIAKIVSSVIASVLFIGIILISTAYFYQNHKIFLRETQRLQNQWQKDEKDGVSPQQIAQLKSQLEKLKAGHKGPFSTTWFTTKNDLNQKINHLQQETQSTWSSAAIQEKKKATMQLKELEVLEGARFNRTVYQKALNQASTPLDYKNLTKKWSNEVKQWERESAKLKKLSSGLTKGLPSDVVKLKSQYVKFLKDNEKKQTGEKVLTETIQYLNQSPSAQIASHATIIHELKDGIATLEHEREVAQFNKEGLFGDNFKKYANSRDDHVSVAVYDANNKHTYLYQSGLLFDTASIVKLTILTDLLHHSKIMGHPLTQSEKNLMKPMIEESSNSAATKLWNLAGGAVGIKQFANRVGMSHTTPGSEGQWGLTKTTALDQVNLLKLIAYPNSILTTSERNYALNLMEHVVNWERWGVSSGVSDATVALKNGWLPYPSKWWVNSVGFIKGNGRNYVISILSKDNPSEQYGIQTDDEISQLIWKKLGIVLN